MSWLKRSIHWLFFCVIIEAGSLTVSACDDGICMFIDCLVRILWLLAQVYVIIEAGYSLTVSRCLKWILLFASCYSMSWWKLSVQWQFPNVIIESSDYSLHQLFPLSIVASEYPLIIAICFEGSWLSIDCFYMSCLIFLDVTTEVDYSSTASTCQYSSWLLVDCFWTSQWKDTRIQRYLFASDIYVHRICLGDVPFIQCTNNRQNITISHV